MSSRVLVAALVLFTNASGLLAQETLFSGENAYNPVPNPGGSKVAYVLTGRGRVGGTGGFGRSNMKSFLAFSSPDGRPISSVLIEGFLDRWLDENSLSFYRDWHFGIATDSGSQLTGSRTIDLNTGPIPSERVTYMATLKKFVWLDEVNGITVLQTPRGPVGSLGIRVPLESLVIPSPNEQYLAVAANGGSLVVYNVRTRKSVNLGHIQIHPAADWDYRKPTWDPWFRDSSRLAFSTGEHLYVASPDGTNIEEVGSRVAGYLPVPAPDGKSIAYVTFVGRPREVRPDLTFWGDATIWVIERGKSESTRITQPTKETTLDIRWLNESTVIFDRMSDQVFPEQSARVWTAKISGTVE